MDTHMIVVAKGEPLPQPGKLFKVVDIMDNDKRRTLKVKRIESLRWHSKNDRLIVEVTGTLRGHD